MSETQLTDAVNIKNVISSYSVHNSISSYYKERLFILGHPEDRSCSRTTPYSRNTLGTNWTGQHYVSRHSQTLLSRSLFTQLVNHRKGKHSPLVLKGKQLSKTKANSCNDVLRHRQAFGHTPFFFFPPLPDN